MSALPFSQTDLLVTRFPLPFMNMLASFDLAKNLAEIEWLTRHFGESRPDVRRKAAQVRGTLMFRREVEQGHTSPDDADCPLFLCEYPCD